MKFVGFILLLFCFKSFSQTLYHVSPTDDLNVVIAALQPGDTVKLEPGIYLGPIVLSNVNGAFDNPIVFKGPSDIANSAVIDGRRPSANTAISYNWLEITNSSWLEFVNLHFQNAWVDPLPINNSTYISFKTCYFQGGRRLINVRGENSHHVLVENCFWDQGGSYAWNVSSWTDGEAWESMHHGELSFLNGSLITMQGTSGSHVIRGNTMQNGFNALRWRGDEGFDANIEIYDNTILNMRDNDFEPEDYAKNLFIHHNWTHNIHKTLSIDHVRGGDIYYFGNIITNDSDDWAEDICTGYYKIYGHDDDNLTDPLYIFNNSYYGSGRLHGSIGDRRMQRVNHFNNAFYLTKRQWELDQWNETLVYDHDCSNRAFSARLTNNGQEANGIIADPLFSDPQQLDLTLQEGSPCVDAGGVVTIPRLNWQSTYDGSAPDIGAYDENHPISGPFYRTDTLAVNNPIPEHPRITRLETRNDSTFLSFSYPLNSASIAGNLTLFGNGGEDEVISSFTLHDDGYTIGIMSRFEVHKALVSGDLKGINGLRATNWANAANFEKSSHDDVVVYMLQPQLQPRVLPPPNSGVYVEGDLVRSIVPKGTVINVKARTDEGYRFERWEGDVNASSDTAVIVTLDQSAWIIGHFIAMEDEVEEEVVLSVEDDSFKVFPNPTSGRLYIADELDDHSVRLVNLTGQSTHLKLADKYLDLGHLKSGLYFIELTYKGQKEIKRIYLR
ncbi:MAG: T9SS type A sorting domain-containing protein [Cyclobacteriaceae bacterium]